MNAQPSRRIVTAAAILMLATGIGGALVGKELIGSDAAGTASSTNAELQNASQPVPFLGPYAEKHKGYAQCGPGVRLMEGALRHTKPPIRRTPAADCIGKVATRQLVAFQKRHHIPPSGIYGRRTHQALAHAYSATQIAGLAFLAAKRVDQLHRDTIGVVVAHSYNARGTMGYCNHGALRDCSLRVVWAAWPVVPTHLDCSSYVSWVFYQAGLPNPNGSGVGTTKTLIHHGQPVALGAPLKVGDLVFYARNNSHVAIYIGHGLVASHGQPGLKLVPWNYRLVYGIRRYF